MEGASGIDLLRHIKEIGLDCPVVMVTGYPNINTATEAVRLGAFDYLSKPVKKHDLLRTARMALQQFALQKEARRLNEEKEKYRLLLEVLTPVAKSYPSEMGIQSISQGLQCLGGEDDYVVRVMHERVFRFMHRV